MWVYFRLEVVVKRRVLKGYCGVQGAWCPGWKGGKGTSQSDAATANTVKPLREQNKKFKRKIKSLKQVTFNDDEEGGKDANNSADDIDAGYQFAGNGGGE